LQKRKPVPKRKKSSIRDKSVVASPSAGSVTDSYATSKRSRRHSNASEGGASPKHPTSNAAANVTANVTATALAVAPSEHSRGGGGGGGERSNPPGPAPATNKPKATSKASAAAAAAKGPTNNKSLLDFFASGPNKKKAAALPNNASATTTTVAASSSSGSAGLAASSSTTTTGASLPTDSDTTTNNNEWFQQCQQLQRDLHDKNEQIKAITDNRTIYQTALSSALTKTKAELAAAQQKLQVHTQETSLVMEDLLRWKSSRQAKELREKLAADGARLGRIVVSRAGMRAMESWEEGHATKDLEHRKLELQAKRHTLEKRLASIRASGGESSSGATTTTTTTTTPTREDANKENRNRQGQEAEEDGNDNALGRTALELMEAKEAIRMHLDNLKRSERELKEEEQALNDEKGAHIRALKQVASEDSSRFRSRPKVCVGGLHVSPIVSYEGSPPNTMNDCSMRLLPHPHELFCFSSLHFGMFLSYTTATSYIVFLEREDSPKCGEDMIWSNYEKLPLKSINSTHDGLIRKKKITRDTCRENTKSIVTFAIHASYHCTMFLKLTTIHSPPSWSAARVPIWTRCSRTRNV
jgi:hypothetical protein